MKGAAMSQTTIPRRTLLIAGATSLFAANAQVTDLQDAINKAGRQRMLSQRIAKSYLALVQGIETSSAQATLDKSLALFDRQLVELRAYAPNTEIREVYSRLDAGWSDLGAWDAVWQVQPKDAQGNAHMGDVLATDSRNTLVHATSRLVSLVGVSDLVVVETPDAVLVADKSRSQDVKHIVTQLQTTKREEHTLHRKVHRPWGWYDSIDEGGRFKVKRIQVKPKASLSLQKHHHRAEHWIVVTGTAEITNGDKVVTLTENQSTYIPLGEVHRLANPGTIPLEIIEVQSGSYLGEDDIVRIQDQFNRV